MAARLTDEQIAYILASPESAKAVERKTGISYGHVSYVRRKHGYQIVHNGYTPPTLNGEPVDVEAFDMPIPKTRQNREVNRDLKAANSFLYG